MKATKLTKETILDLGKQERTFPSFAVGDCIAISQRIKEGDKERLQVFEGDVIAMHNSGGTGTFTVRKIAANGVAVERIFPFATPMIEAITLIRQGDVRRSKLYYLRDRVGRAARIKEHVVTKEEKLHKVQKEG